VSDDPTATIRHTIYFTGRVQGVGFRANTVRVAEGHDVVGVVRNLSDGRVECIAEGSPAALAAFLDDLLRVMGRHVREHRVITGPANGEFGEPGEGICVRY
jgi:acylphosphatase